MDTSALPDRINRASIPYSFRQIAKWCAVSHEQIRRLSLSPVAASKISVDMYNRIDKGLAINGF